MTNVENKSIITITYCECSENHVGMEKNGLLATTGFSLEDLLNAMKESENRGLKADLYGLHLYIEEPLESEIAWVLVIRGALSNITGKDSETAYEKLNNLTWDDKYYDVRRKRVLNKRARTNICIGETSQKANFEEKKGTIYSFSEIPVLETIRAALPQFLGDKAKNMLAEGNCYTDGGIKNTGIGYHGDSERKRVVGVRFGPKGLPQPSLYYRWYQNSKVISGDLEIPLFTGDIYIMSEKAVGTDWRKRVNHETKKPLRTLRHATGAPKYVSPKIKG